LPDWPNHLFHEGEMAASIDYAWMESPVGKLMIAGDVSGVRQILFTEGRLAVGPKPGWNENAEALGEVIRQLRAYFSGSLREFRLPLAPEGTPFQQRVWQKLRNIPYGSTISYGELARRLGNPSAYRAVGMANGANPISIVLPCHRVIGSNGKLTGYGGGLKNKAWLLALERAQIDLPLGR
jgi:methylated-DNA-[protein]-cysteine S-methyltransferase